MFIQRLLESMSTAWSEVADRVPSCKQEGIELLVDRDIIVVNLIAVSTSK